MKHIFLALLAAVILASCSRTEPAHRPVAPATFTSFDTPPPDEQPTPAHAIKFEQATLDQVLQLYAQTSRRSIIRGSQLPEVKITFSNELPMTRVQILQALDTVLAAQGIATIPQGTEYIKVVPDQFASRETPPILTGSADKLPESSSYVIYAMEVKPGVQVVPPLTPFSHLPNSIIYVPGDTAAAAKQVPVVNEVHKFLGAKTHNLLILRDYSNNVRKMLQVVNKLQSENQ